MIFIPPSPTKLQIKTVLGFSARGLGKGLGCKVHGLASEALSHAGHYEGWLHNNAAPLLRRWHRPFSGNTTSLVDEGLDKQTSSLELVRELSILEAYTLNRRPCVQIKIFDRTLGIICVYIYICM